MRNKYVLLLLFSFVSVIALNAHPPSSVQAEFDKKSLLLNVSYQHQVKNNSNHYIYNILIKKNNKVILDQKLGYQDSLGGGALVYKINDLKPKDKLQITAHCIKGGTKSTVLTIQ